MTTQQDREELTAERLADLVPQTATILEKEDGTRKTCMTFSELKQFAAALLAEDGKAGGEVVAKQVFFKRDGSSVQDYLIIYADEDPSKQVRQELITRVVDLVPYHQPAQVAQPLTEERIYQIAEPFGAFEYGDAQGHKRIAFARAVEAAHGITKNQRCELCNYQHGHAIGCENNPIDIALREAAHGIGKHQA